MTRAIDGTELNYLRTDGQASALFLAFPESHIIFSAVVDGTPGSLDQVIKIAYRDVTTGAYADIQPMSTLWVGTAAGLYDKGIARVRTDADATYIYIGETSSINFADGDYITVVDDFLPWQRFGRIKTSDPITTCADWDIDFSDQYTSPNPVANLGPDGVYYLPDGNISSASLNLDASGSFMPDGSGIASHSWGGAGVTFDDSTSATPAASVTAAGTYKVFDTVTGSNGKSTTAWRTLCFYDQTNPPVNQFNLTSMPSCDRDNDGGWSFTVRMYDQAAFSSVKDRQQVILFARDWYGDTNSLYTNNISFNAATHSILCPSSLDRFPTGASIFVKGSANNDGVYSVQTGGVATAIVVNEKLVDESAGASITISIFQGVVETSLGPIQYRENILCEGWIDTESMHFDPNGAYVDFTVQPMSYWLNQMTEYILGIDDVDSASTDWIHVNHLFWDFGLFVVLYWHSTLCFISDYYPTGDTRPVLGMSEQEGSIWAQLKSSAWNNILAILCCNRYGQLYAFIPPELIPSGSRSGIPVVMTVTTNDTELGKLDLAREPQPKTAFLAGAGGEYAWGSSGIATERLAYSPGASYKEFGISDTLPQIVVTDQAQLNSLNSLYISRANNTYPNIPLSLAQNNRFVDCAPAQYLYIDLAAANNPRGVEFASNIIPKTVSLNFDVKLGTISCIVTAYAETFEDLVVTGVIPAPTPPTTPTLPPIPLPIYPPVPWMNLPGNGIKGALTLDGTWDLVNNYGTHSSGFLAALTKNSDGSFADTSYFSYNSVTGKVTILKSCFYLAVVNITDVLNCGAYGALGMLGCEIRITFAGGGNSVIGSQVVVVNSGQAYIISGPLMENGHVGDVIDTIFFGDPLLAAPHEPWGAGSGTGRLQFLVVG